MDEALPRSTPDNAENSLAFPGVIEIATEADEERPAKLPRIAAERPLPASDRPTILRSVVKGMKSDSARLPTGQGNWLRMRRRQKCLSIRHKSTNTQLRYERSVFVHLIPSLWLCTCCAWFAAVLVGDAAGWLVNLCQFTTPCSRMLLHDR